MEGKQQTPAGHQIKGKLGDQGEEEHPPQIPLKIVGPGIAFRDLEGKDGKGQPAQVCHPLAPGHNGGPHVIAEHQRHGQQLQRQSIQTFQVLNFLHKVSLSVVL